MLLSMTAESFSILFDEEDDAVMLVSKLDDEKETHFKNENFFEETMPMWSISGIN